jgi:hypothetical protein
LTDLIEFQILFQLQIGVSVDEVLDKVLTKPVSPVLVDSILDGPTMLEFLTRTGQDHDLEGPLSNKTLQVQYY